MRAMVVPLHPNADFHQIQPKKNIEEPTRRGKGIFGRDQRFVRLLRGPTVRNSTKRKSHMCRSRFRGGSTLPHVLSETYEASRCRKDMFPRTDRSGFSNPGADTVPKRT